MLFRFRPKEVVIRKAPACHISRLVHGQVFHVKTTYWSSSFNSERIVVEEVLETIAPHNLERWEENAF